MRKSSAELLGSAGDLVGSIGSMGSVMLVGVSIGVATGVVTEGSVVGSVSWVGFGAAGFLAGFGVGFGADFEVGFGAVDFLVVLGVGLAALVVLVVFLVVETLVAVVLERRGAKPSIDLFLSIVYNYNIMGIKLTKKQLAVLNFLEDFAEENGYSPSYREIQAGLGLSSVSVVAEHIDNLVAKGVLKKVPGAARSLEILDYKHEETVGLFKARLVDCSDTEREVLLKAAEILGLDLE